MSFKLRGKVKKMLSYYQDPQNYREKRLLFRKLPRGFGNHDLGTKDRIQLVSILKGFSKINRSYSMLLDKDISYVVRSI